MFRKSALLAALPLCACATAGESPSLAPRPIELRFQAPDEPPPPPPPPLPADAPLAARIEALLGRVREGETAFAAAVSDAEQAVSAAGATGSESWVVAHQRVTALEGLRAPSTIALAELDRMLVERMNAVATGEAESGVAELQAAQAEAGRIVDGQNQRIDSLRRRLSD